MKVKAVIFDWAGTTVDFGSLAPVRTLQRVFAEAGMPITEQQARQDMGIAKRDHIAAILTALHLDLSRLDELYQKFVPLQFACLREYSDVIDGVPEVVGALRSQGIKIGSTTGYTRAMLDILVEQASVQSYTPDCSFSPQDAGSGRPHPFMIFAAAIKLQVYPLNSIIKVGDTPSDIAEGLNAGTWTVGVAATGNAVGLSKAEFDALPETDRHEKLESARAHLSRAGAHYVIDTLQDLPSVIAKVNLA